MLLFFNFQNVFFDLKKEERRRKTILASRNIAKIKNILCLKNSAVFPAFISNIWID